MNVVFCSSECVPFAKTGGLGDVCGALPLELEKFGVEVSVFLPHYRGVEAAGFPIKKIGSGLSMTTIGRQVKVFFVEHQDYYQRNGLYGDQHRDFPDNLNRFQFFCRRVLETVAGWPERPDIIHCHDWQTGLIPVYLKAFYRNSPLSRTRTVLTIHNIGYQGIFPKEQVKTLGLDHDQFFQFGLEYFNQINLLKTGIVNADVVTTVSPTYAQEIQTRTYGSGLDGVLRSRTDGVMGILNGIDTEYWNPADDPLIRSHFSAESVDKKYLNKRDLQVDSGFSPEEDVPVFGFVGRLAQQKGLDLLSGVMETLSRQKLQIVLLGVGEQRYHDMLRYLSNCYSSRLRVFFKFDEPLAHQVYSGSDFFLMPSQYEPCGLSQMISLRYGAIPVVYKTGGLADTITPYHMGGNGFVFEQYTKESFLAAILEAIQVYQDRSRFRQLVRHAFDFDFSWRCSAEKYVELYERLVGR